MTSLATLIGDVVGSRAASDRGGLHGELQRALDEVNTSVDPVTPLRITVGDEYQGAYESVGIAVRAALRLRLALIKGGVDVRHGVGWGPVEVLGDEPRVEDGPGWWSAREAIERVAQEQNKPATRSVRTGYVRGDESGPTPEPINAALAARDELLEGAGETGLSVVAGMLSGMSQQQIAAELGVSASAVSQRIRRAGLATIVHVDELLGSI